MLSSPSPEPKSALKNPLLYSSIAFAAVLLYVGWIFFSRWQENHDIEMRSQEERRQQQLQSDRAALEMLGGKELAIQMLYASPGAIRRGESARLCYGVANAKTVKLEPQSNQVWPSYSRCVEVSPDKTTTYKLTIADAAGNTKTQTVEVKVH